MKDLFKYKILLVDDKEENLFALSSVLKSAGYITESVPSGSEALKLLLKNEYGLIILDVQMPHMSGFELAELIKGNRETKDIPLIFLSANASQKEYIKLGYELGALDYLIKPIDETLLKLKVKNFLAIHHDILILKKTNNDLEEKAISANISYQDLYKSLSQEVFLINKAGIIVNINRNGILMCGMHTEEIINKQFLISTFLNEIFENDYSNFINYFEHPNQKHTIEFKVKKEKGVFFYGKASILLTLINGIPHLQISIFDVTENKEKERKLELHLKVIDHIGKINQSIINGDSIKDFATKLFNSINDLISVKLACVYTFDDYENKLDLISDKIDKNFEVELEKIIGPYLEKVISTLKVDSVFKKIVEDKVPLITSDENLIIDLIEEQWDNNLFKKNGGLTKKLLNVKTFGIIPIVSNNVLFGLITFSSETIIKNEELDALFSFSKSISFAINKKQDEVKLFESEERFNLAMQGVNEGLWDWNLITNRVYYSPVWKSMLGYYENELNGDITTFENLIHKDDLELTFKNINDYLEGRIKKYETEFRLKHKNGSYLTFLSRGYAIKDNNGKYYRMIGTQVDITQSKKDDLFFQQINDSLSVNIGPSYFSEFTKFCCENLAVKFALVGVFNQHNDEIESISFRSYLEELPTFNYPIGNSPFNATVLGGVCNYIKNIQDAFPNYEELIKFGIHSYLGLPLFDENKSVIGIIVVMDDKPMADVLYKEKLLKFLTPRTTNELIGLKINKQLKDSESFAKGILSSLSSQIAVINSNGIIISTNDAWNNYSNDDGKKIPELTGVGLNYFDTFNIAIKNGDIYSQKALIGIKSVLNNELKRFELEYPFHSELEDQWFLLSVSGFEGSDKKAVISHIDITERKKIEQKIKNSEERYRHLFERNLAGVYRADLNAMFLECNDAFAQIIGFKTSKDVIGKYARELYDNISHQDFVKKVSENNYKISGNECSIRLKNGRILYLLENASIIEDENGKNSYIEGSMFDITDRKRIESQLQKTVNELINKNNDLMQFNYIVSHNLRAPIANILGLVSVLNYQNSESETKKIIEYIGQSIFKMDDLVKDLNEMLAIRSLISTKKEIVNIKNVIDSIFHSIEKQRVESNALIKIDIKKEANEIKTIKSYFESILYNLISNAVKYKSPLRQLELSIIIKKENDTFKIIISDNGIGIDLVQNGKDIFGLYKRFNVEQEGKGLGLYMVKKQIEAINGEIKIESELNKGTTFLITI